MSTGMNRSPPRGGAAAGAQNQQFVMDDLEDEEPAPEPALDKKARKRAKVCNSTLPVSLCAHGAADMRPVTMPTLRHKWKHMAC